MPSFNTLLYYSETIFGLLGLKNSAGAGLIPSGCNALCVLLGINIVDRVGRRRLFMVMIPGMFIGLVWAMISFYCESSLFAQSGEVELTASPIEAHQWRVARRLCVP